MTSARPIAEAAIEPRAVSSLKPYPRNARTHSKKQLQQIAASIERFGFTNPVLVSDDLEIIAGHGRVEAAKLLGLKTVPTIALSHLSEAERRAYVLADNKLALNAGWDRDMLAIELQGLIDLEFDVELTGFGSRTELIILLTPTVIRAPQDNGAIVRELIDAAGAIAERAVERGSELVDGSLQLPP